jgi:metal-responsive CopG/Arc/MetJ family transcriptional regulator
MRLHISLDDDLAQELDRRVGRRSKSAFISMAVRRALEDERWDEIESGLGVLSGHAHEWDDDPAAWVTAQRWGDPTRVG